MGEPLHNLESVLASIDIMTSPLGLHMSRNKVQILGCLEELVCQDLQLLYEWHIMHKS